MPTDGGWVPIARFDELPEGRGRSVEVGAMVVALVRDGAAVHAFSDRCPHAGGSLGSGWVEGDELVCPLHRWRFRLRDGRCVDVRGHEARRWPCRVRDGVVEVRLG